MEKLDVAIVVSSKDSAGMNIAEQLQQMQEFPSTVGDKKIDLFFREEYIIAPDSIDKEIDAGIFMFASRHVSNAGIHSLSIHSIGNWGKRMGSGKARSLVPAPAALMKTCFKLLIENAEKAKLDYEIIQEATHHGPCMEKPSMFIEIGSDEEHWKDESAGKVVAATIIGAIKNFGSSRNEKIKTVIGLGGMHHSPNFAKVMLADNTAVSYVCPKYMLESLDERMLKQAMQKSIPRAGSVVLDWKGLGKEKERIVKLLQEASINYERTKDFKA